MFAIKDLQKCFMLHSLHQTAIMKGDRGRTVSQFKNDHKFLFTKQKCFEEEPEDAPKPTQSTSSDTKWKRLPSSSFSTITKVSVDGKSFTSPDCDGNPGTAKFLRPKTTKSSSELQKNEKDEELKGMRLLDNEELLKMMNAVYKYHQEESPECHQPDFTISKQTKQGICWKYTMACSKCELITPEYKMYKEIETNLPGPNAAAPNVSLAVGLQDTPIGNTKARLLIASMDVPPPAKKVCKIQQIKWVEPQLSLIEETCQRKLVKFVKLLLLEGSTTHQR